MGGLFSDPDSAWKESFREAAEGRECIRFAIGMPPARVRVHQQHRGQKAHPLHVPEHDTDIQATQQAEIQALKDKQQAEIMELKDKQQAGIMELKDKYADGNELCELSVDDLLNDFIPRIRQTFKDQKFDTNEQQFDVPGRT